MRLLKLIAKWGGIPVSAVITGTGIYLDATEAMALGIPSWVWLMVGYCLLVILAVFIIIGLWRENKLLRIFLEKERNEPLSDTEFKLRQMRISVRNTKVAEIPSILLDLRREVIKTMDSQKLIKIDPKILIAIVIDTLGLKQNDALLHSAYNEKSIKMLQSKMGLKKWNEQIAQDLQIRMAEKMDNYQVGITDALSAEYKSKKDMLDEIIMTSDKRLDEKIENYLTKLISLHNLRLYIHYTQATKDPQVKEFFQKPESKGLSREAERRMLRAIRHSLQEVLTELEKYQTGERLDGD